MLHHARAAQPPAASRSARSKPASAALREEPVEVLVGVRDEVDVEGADPLLEDAPHRLAEVGHDPHQEISAGQAAPGAHVAVVGRQQDRVLVRRQLVVDAEVAQVEERVAHPGVLPVDDPDPLAVVDEVGVEQVVVAGAQLDRAARRASSIRRPIASAELVLGRDRHATGDRQRPVGLDDPERDEQARDGRAVVDAADRVGHPAERLRLVDRLVG